MKVIITGSTGMVGKGVLLECLDHIEVSKVLVVNRNPLGIVHDKLKEVLVKEFMDLSSIHSDLDGYDTCFFCLGVSSFRMSESDYSRMTYDLTIHFAKTILTINPDMIFSYVSGQGTDSSELGKVMWARVKGRTENTLLHAGFRRAYMFRPGYIHPMKGVKSRTALYNSLISVAKYLYPLANAVVPNSLTTSEKVGLAMINAVLSEEKRTILGPKEINELAGLRDL